MDAEQDGAGWKMVPDNKLYVIDLTTNPPDAAGKGSKRSVDWETIEREYRAGVLSRREIAKRHDVSEGAIRKRAKRDHWLRDLTARVREKVRMELVRAQVREPNARTDQEIVDEASQEPIAVGETHRKDLKYAREMGAMLMAQLKDAAGGRESLEEQIESTDPVARRSAMLRAVSLPQHAATLRDLTIAYKNLIPLERQAFNMDDKPVENSYEELLDRALALNESASAMS